MNAPLRFSTGALRSLWDIMRPFHAYAFLSAKGFLRNYHSYSMLSRLSWLGLMKDMTAGKVIDKGHRTTYLGAWDSMRPFVEELDLDASLTALDRMLTCLKDKRSTFGEYWKLAADFERRLEDQMKGRMFLSLNSWEASTYTDPLSGWQEIVAQLPDSQRDIEEARKCQALSRYAAAVFHSLQVVEHGMIALGDAFSVTDHIKGWTATKARLEAIRRTKYPDRSPLEQKHSAFLEQMHPLIDGLSLAWRNKVSHAHGKLTLMTADFTPEVTEEIIIATRAFMRRLVTEGPLA